MTTKFDEKTIAYLTSHYPAVSHTFIQREISAIRELGLPIETFSIRRPPAKDPLSARDKKELAQTFYLLPIQIWSFLAAHISNIVNHPKSYLACLLYAQRLAKNTIHSRLYHFIYFLEAIYLGKQLQKKNIRHVHVHFAMSCATVALIAVHGRDLTFSLTIHGQEVFHDPEKFLLKEKANQALFVCCISKYGCNEILRLLPHIEKSKVHLIRCGLELQNYTPVSARKNTNRLRLLNVARLVPLKRQELLIRAIALLGDRVELCTFVGSGPEHNRLQLLTDKLGASDRIRLVGAVDQDHIEHYFQNADVFVLTSDDEGIPVSVMEAMAHQIPVISTKAGAVAELIEHNQTGLLIECGSAEELVDAILRLSENHQLRTWLGVNGRAVIEASFDVQVSATSLVRLFSAT